MAPRPAYKQMMEHQRRVDAIKEQNIRFTEENKTTHFFASWENKTDARLAQKRRNDRIASLKRGHKEELLQRKRVLAALLNEEMDGWQQEIANAIETPEERNAKLSQRALALRDARERERQQFVDECYKLQWKLSCDDGRLMDGKEMIKFIGSERQRQIELRETHQRELKQRDDQLVKQWMAEMDAMDAREKEKEVERALLEKEIKGILDQQVDAHQQKKHELAARNAHEAEEELAELAIAKEKEAKKARERIEKARARGRGIREFNESRRHIGDEVAAKEQAEELLLLQYALDKEKADEASEMAKKEQEKETTKRYQEFLRLQMIKEAENGAIVDEMRKAEEDRIWAKKEGEQKARDDARQYLMKVTNAGRQEQIRDRRQREQREREEDLMEDMKFGSGQDELDRIEAEKASAKKQAMQENLTGIKSQIAYKRKERKREEQDKFLESKIMDKVEREHRERLSQQAGKVRLYFPIKHTSWYT